MKACDLSSKAQGLFPDRFNQKATCPGLPRAGHLHMRPMLSICANWSAPGFLWMQETGQSCCSLGTHRSSLWLLLASCLKILVTNSAAVTSLLPLSLEQVCTLTRVEQDVQVLRERTLTPVCSQALGVA